MRRFDIKHLIPTVLLGCALAVSAHAQTARQFVGTWVLVSNTNTAADGTKTEPYTDKPLGIAIYAADGHYTQILVRPGIPKIAANNRLQGTADENKAIVQGSIANFGTYSVHGKELELKVKGSTYPNYIGADLKWTVAIKGRTATFDLPATIGGQTESVWRRVK
jgi:hypothetical protein